MSSFSRSVLNVFRLFQAENVPVIAGVDAGGVPRPVMVGPDGTLLSAIPGISVPSHDFVGLTYVGSTNNVDTVTYKQGGSGGTVVATLTLSYVGGTPASDDAKIASVTRS